MKIRTLAPLGLSLAVAAAIVAVAANAQAPAATPPASSPPPAAAPPAAPPAAAAPPRGNAMVDTTNKFDHDIHLNAAKMGKPLGCESCHEMVKSDGTCPKSEVRFPKHEACATCHAANFYTPPLTICTNCHTSAKFSKKNELLELTRQVTPRKAEFSHKTHLDAKKGTDCTTCHEMKKGGDVVGHPSHPNCCQCHADGKTTPQMKSCEGCHSASKNAGRPPSKIHDFSHKAHKEDPRNSSSTSCQLCHVNMAEATTLRNIHIPPMPVCVQCHDGSDPNKPNPSNPALKGTGAFHFSSCLKCHISGSINGGMPLPPGHPPPTEVAPPGAIK